MAGPAAIGMAAAKALPKIARFAKGVGAAKDVIGELGRHAGETKSALLSMANAIGGKWIEMQDIAFQTGRSMAMSREMAMRYDRQLMQSTKELARQYGITAKEMADFQKSYGEAIGRNVVLTKRQIESMAALSKITDSATAAQLVDEFDKLGVGVEGSTAKIGLLQERAKALGVNASKAAKNLASNIQLASRYSFKNGVADLEKMAIKSASLRMDMSAVMSAADKFMDIDSAIGTSARLQMLGGSFGAMFSNPMGAMYEAQADPKAFMDRLEKLVAGKGRYDSKTGQVTFDPVTMMQMREAAKQLGMSVEQLTNPAMAEVQNAKVVEELQKAGKADQWGPEALEAIKNLSRTNVGEDGKHFVTYMDEDGKTVQRNIEDLTKEELQIAQDRQMSEEGLFSDVQNIKDILERTLGRARGTTSTKENITGLGEEWNAFVAQFQNMFMPLVSGWMNGPSFQPWDILKGLTSGFGNIGFGSRGVEGFGFSNPYAFAEGGVVEPIPHAAMGTIIPGDSYSGDKTPIMANAGEMVLNQREQSGLFNILKSIATTGAMMYGGNKLGKMFGLKGLGTQMGLGNLLTGGQMGIGGMLGTAAGSIAMNKMMPMRPMSIMPISPFGMRGLGTQMGIGNLLGGGQMGIGGMLGTAAGSIAMNKMMPMSPMSMMPMSPFGMMNRPFTLMNPTVVMNGQTIMNGSIADGSLVEQLEDVANSAALASKSTKSFSTRLMSLAKKRTLMGSTARGLLHANRSIRRTGEKISNGRIGHFYRNRIAEIKLGKAYAADWWSNTKLASGIKNFKTDIKSLFVSPTVGQEVAEISEAPMSAKQKRLSKRNRAKALKSLKDVRKTNAIAKNVTETTKSVSKVGEVVKSGAVSKTTKAVANATAKGGKLLGTLGKAGRFLGKAAGPLGTALAIGGAISDISSANSQYDAQVDEIERSGMSDREKARARDRASKQKNAGIGGGIGSAVGATAGMALGSVLGPLGAIGGAWLGEKAGNFIGKGIGSLFGGGEEKKYIENEKEKAKAIAGNNEDIVKVLNSINEKVAKILFGGNSIKKHDLFRFEKGIKKPASLAISSLLRPLSTVAKTLFGTFISPMKQRKDSNEGLKAKYADRNNAYDTIKSLYEKATKDNLGIKPIEITKPKLEDTSVISEILKDLNDKTHTITKDNVSIRPIEVAKPIVGKSDDISEILKGLNSKTSIPTKVTDNFGIKPIEMAKPKLAESNKALNYKISISDNFGIKPIEMAKPKLAESNKALNDKTSISDNFIIKPFEIAKPKTGESNNVSEILKGLNGRTPVITKVTDNFGIKPIEMPKSAISLSPIGATPTVKSTKTEQTVKSVNTLGKTDINLNISGTIKLEGGNKSADLDLSKLLDTPEFKRQIADMVSRRLNELGNAGGYRKENAQTNTSKMYNGN